MILTGKAKEDFEKWYVSEIRKKDGVGDRYWDHSLLEHFWKSGSTMIHAFITEWLDNVYIYVNVVPIIYDNKKGNQVRAFDSVVDHKVNGVWKNRQKATEAAIKEGNEIYNQKHK